MTVESVRSPAAALDPLREELERLISPADPESLWACEQALARAIAGGAFADFANDVISALLTDPKSAPPPTSPLIRQSAFRLAIVSIDQALITKHGEEIPAHAQHMLLANLGPGPCELRLYEREHLDAVEVFDASVRLVDRGERRLLRGEIMRVRAGAELFHIAKVEAPTVFVVLFGPTVYETVTVYGNDLTAQRQYAAKLSTTRAQTALTLLNELSAHVDDELTGAVVSMLAHPAHVVRWAAANALSRVSDGWREFALDRLRHDPHPHVRNAVRRSLEDEARGA